MKNGYDDNKGRAPSSPSGVDAITDLVGELDSNDKNNKWRRYGIERRRELIEQDTAEGGNRFDLNFECRIQGYFALSEKIITRFDESFANGNDLEAIYVMGNRLIHFLTEALPMHPSYMKRDPVITRLRDKSFQSLVRIKKQMDAIALRIDEEELNKYILHDFDPFADESDDDSCSSAGSDVNQAFPTGLGRGQSKDAIQWESFDGWSFDLPAKMTTSQSDDFVLHNALFKSADESGDTEESSEASFQDSDSCGQEPIYSYGLEFLKQISSEAVKFETDSEADDSWAQESEEELEIERGESDGDTSYDPARIALQELIINKRLLQKCNDLQNGKGAGGYYDEQLDDSKENQSLDFDLSPDNTFDADADADEEDIWIAFDPTVRLPEVPTESVERVSL